MSDEPKEEKKIIIDEDWKSRVEAEREAAREAQESADRPADQPSAATAPLPPPSLTFLASNLYLQGMIALGLLPSPGSDKPEVHLDQAKHSIDLLDILYHKTEGNRTPEETKEMDTVLHELRLSYVAVQQQAKDQ